MFEIADLPTLWVKITILLKISLYGDHFESERKSDSTSKKCSKKYLNKLSLKKLKFQLLVDANLHFI